MLDLSRGGRRAAGGGADARLPPFAEGNAGPVRRPGDASTQRSERNQDMTLGQNISRLRTEQGLSQGDLAEALDVSRQSISKWETDASIPELEKLLRLSELFHITLDELVKGTGGSPETPPPTPEPSAAKEDAPWQPEAQLLQTLDRQMNRTVGWVLLGFGALLTLLLAMLGDGLAGLLLASPLFLCGIICLVARKRPGLWCAWACGLLGLIWLRATAGIRWTDIFRAPSTVFRSDVAQIVSWAIAVFLLLLLIGTVRSFRDQVLPWEKRNIGKYAGLWGLYLVGRWAVNRFLFAAWAMKVFSSGNHTQSAAVVYSIANILWEVALLTALALLLVKTAALLRGRKAGSAAAH